MMASATLWMAYNGPLTPGQFLALDQPHLAWPAAGLLHGCYSLCLSVLQGQYRCLCCLSLHKRLLLCLCCLVCVVHLVGAAGGGTKEHLGPLGLDVVAARCVFPTWGVSARAD